MGKKISEDYFQATHCFAIVFLSFLRQQKHLNFRATTKKHRDEQKWHVKRKKRTTEQEFSVPIV